MKIYYIYPAVITFVLLSILVSGCTDNPDTQPDDRLKEITETIATILPENWQIARYEMNTFPLEYTGPKDCIYIGLEDPTVTYIHPEQGFEYTSFYDIWFAPADWSGVQNEIKSNEQKYPATLLIQTSDHQIYCSTLGNNTAPDLMVDLIIAFA